MRARHRSLAAPVALALLAFATPAFAAGENRNGVRLLPVARANQPIQVTAPPADRRRLFVVERTGRVRVIRDGRMLARPFLSLRGRVGSGGERGMLSIAFPPDYATSGRVYVAFNLLDGTIRVEEYRRSAANPDVADPASRREIISIPHPFFNHNSGQMQFGPDGMLYLGTGDGGSHGDPQNNAQNLNSLLGKILRLDPRPGQSLAPPGNPFTGRPGARPEIFAYGLRNPWRFSFDRLNGAFTLADVGQDEVEEFDYRAPGTLAGSNFGWNRCEGDQAFPPTGIPRAPCVLPGVVAPALTQLHSQRFCAGIGGFVVRDRTLTGLYGRYVYGDFCRPDLRSARLNGSPRYRDDRPIGLGTVALSSFGEGPGGCLYIASLGDGMISRIAPAGGSTRAPCPGGGPGPITNPPADRTPPVLTLGVTPQPALRTRLIGLDVTCDEPCTATGTATAATSTLRTAPLRLTGGLASRLRFTLHGKDVRALTGPRVSVPVTVTVRDAAGNRTTRTVSARLTR